MPTILLQDSLYGAAGTPLVGRRPTQFSDNSTISSAPAYANAPDADSTVVRHSLVLDGNNGLYQTAQGNYDDQVTLLTGPPAAGTFYLTITGLATQRDASDRISWVFRDTAGGASVFLTYVSNTPTIHLYGSDGTSLDTSTSAPLDGTPGVENRVAVVWSYPTAGTGTATFNVFVGGVLALTQAIAGCAPLAAISLGTSNSNPGGGPTTLRARDLYLTNGTATPPPPAPVATSATPPAAVATLGVGTLTAGLATATSILLAVDGTTGGTFPYSFQFQQAPDAGGVPGAWTNTGPAVSAASTTAAGLTPGTTYWFRAVETDAGSPPQAATTAAVAAPTGPLVLPGPPTLAVTSAGGMDAIAITPGSAGTYAIASYQTFSGTTAGGESATPLSTIAASAPLGFANNSGGFFYTCRAVDSQGNPSPASNEVEGGAATGAITLGQEQTLLNNLATVLLANIGSLLASFFAARDAAPIPQAAQDLIGSIVDTQLATTFAARDAAPVPAAAQSLLGQIIDARIAAAYAAAPGSTPGSRDATLARVNQLPTADQAEAIATTTDSIKDLLDGVGPLGDAVGILTGYWKMSPDGQTVIEYTRQGVEIDRYPAAGRTAITLPVPPVTP